MKIHKITIMIVDSDDLGAAGVKLELENANYPNDCISPTVVEIDTREVEWSDDHPLNNYRTRFAEFRRMFGAEDAVGEEGTHLPRPYVLESKIGAVDPHESICTWPIDGRAPGKAARPCNRTDCPHCRPRTAPPVGWRYVVTFPVELEENEAAAIEEELRKKFTPERLKEYPQAADLLDKMRRVLDKFRDKRRTDEELAASLTDEERQIIRDRRNSTSKKAT